MKVQIIADTDGHKYKLSPRLGLVELERPKRFISIANLKRHIKPMVSPSKWGVVSYPNYTGRSLSAHTSITCLRIGCKIFTESNLQTLIQFVRGL